MNRYTEEKIILYASQLNVSERHRSLLKGMLTDTVNWDYILGRTSEEGTTGLVYKTMKRLGNDYLSKISCADAFSRIYSETVFANTMMFEEFERVLDILEKYQIPVILLRGYAMIHTIYKDPGLRPCDDIDILVKKENLSIVNDLLIQLGFYSPPSYPLLYLKNDLMIDVHLDLAGLSRIQSRRFGFKEEAALWWENCRNFPVPASNRTCTTTASSYKHVFILNTHDFIITSAIHLLKHSFRRLIWFIDIKEMVEYEKPVFDWSRFLDRIKFLEVQKPVYYPLTYIQTLYHGDVPQPAIEELGKGLNTFEKVITRLLLKNKKVYRWGDIVFLFSIKNPRERLRYLIETYFPRREVMSQIFGISHSALIYFSYVIRFWQVIYVGSRESIRLLFQVLGLLCRLRK